MAKLLEAGIDVNLEREKRNRFKTIQSETVDGKETFYYNDGSENGLRVVTFCEVSINLPDFETNKDLKMEVKYY